MISKYIIPTLFIIVFTISIIKKKNTYESFIEGIKDGFKSSLRIAPSMLAMYICINALRLSGLIEFIFKSTKIPADLLAQAVIRPMSSQASLAFMIKIYNEYGASSKLAFVSSILQGSTDASLYVISFYIGTFKIKSLNKCFLIAISVNIIIFVICLIIYLIL